MHVAAFFWVFEFGRIEIDRRCEWFSHNRANNRHFSCFSTFFSAKVTRPRLNKVVILHEFHGSSILRESFLFLRRRNLKSTQRRNSYAFLVIFVNARSKRFVNVPLHLILFLPGSSST
jgi:hypothetical protein